MQIDTRQLEERFASMNYEELLDLKREDLTETAQRIYDLEIARRGLDKILAFEAEIEQVEASIGEPNIRNEDDVSDPDWHHDGVVACSFVDGAAHLGSENGADLASKAQAVLHAAGIPNHLRVSEDPDTRHSQVPQKLLEVLVPVKFAIHALSILDRDLLNIRFETEWREQLSMLSKEDLVFLDPAIFCAGLIDKVSRMKRIYAEELAKRKLQ
jgi:hypothetical protein